MTLLKNKDLGEFGGELASSSATPGRKRRRPLRRPRGALVSMVCRLTIGKGYEEHFADLRKSSAWPKTSGQSL